MEDMEHHGSGGWSGKAHSPLAEASLSEALRAARALEACFREDREHSVYLQTVADLARDLGDDLSSLADSMGVSEGPALVSAALRAADLSTLAACALPELRSRSAEYYGVAAAAHAASGVARSLVLEHRSLRAENGREGSQESYEAHDLRGAAWRASLAARQTDEALQSED